MKKSWALFKKEFRTYFNSPIATILITALLVGVGYFFFQTFFVSGQASLRSFFTIASWSFVLFGPAITMKLFAEEKKSGTIEPLLTLPVKEWEVVAGKFFAAWALLAVYLLVTIAYPITISFIGDLDLGPVIGGYLGLFFVGGIFIALGVFASTLSKNQVISLIVAFVIGLFLFLLDLLLPFIPVAFQSFFEYLGAGSHFKNISRGIIDTRDMIYAFSLMGLFLFLAVQILQARLTDGTKVRRVNKILYIGSVIGFLVALNVTGASAYGRLDLTEDKMFTLTEASENLVKGLPDQLTVKAYFSKDLPAPFNNHARYLRDQLEEFRNKSNGNFVFEFVDMEKGEENGDLSPKLTAEVKTAKIPQVEVRKLEKDKVQMVKAFMGIAIYYQDKIETIPVLQNLDDLEYELSSRIVKLVRDSTPNLAFLIGHGELSSSEGTKGALGVLGDKYKISDVDLSRGGSPLAGIDILVIAGPKTEIPPYQRFMIDQFIMDGGKVAFLIDRQDIDLRSSIGRPISVGLEDQLRYYGIHIGPYMLLDKQNQPVQTVQRQGSVQIMSSNEFPPFVKVTDLAKGSPLVKNMTNLVFPFTSPVKIIEREGVDAEVIAKSSPQTWLFETDDSFLVEPAMIPPAETDGFIGPQNILVTLSGGFESYYKDHPIPSKEEGAEPVATEANVMSPDTRLVVVGSSVWLSDAMQNRLGYVFFANLVDWLAQDEKLIGIRTRNIINRPLDVQNETKKNIIKYGNMILLPFAFVIFGILQWRVRLRKRRKGVE